MHMYIMNIRTKYRIYIQTFLKTLLSVTHTHTHTHFYILNTEPTYRLSYRLSSLSHTHSHTHIAVDHGGSVAHLQAGHCGDVAAHRL